MKYIHVAYVKREDKIGLQLGGVPTFAWFLQRAIPDMVSYSFSDFPGWLNCRDRPDPEKAEAMNNWLLDNGLAGKDTIAIVDGYWGRGLQGKVGRLISVVHGSYFGRLIQSQINPWGEPVSMYDVDSQLEFWSDERVEKVCVCQAVKEELEASGMVDELFHVIRLGIPIDEYVPVGRDPMLKISKWMHGVDLPLKGADVIGILIQQFKFEIDAFADRSGEIAKRNRRFSQADCILAPSHYEGCPYFVMEALSCGVPVIANEIGLMREMDERVGLLTDDLAPENFARLMRKFDPRDHKPREWAVENCNVDRFIEEWRSYVK
jgi:hypothetical protein